MPPRPEGPVGDDLVNLGDWLRGQEPPKSTRMVVDEQAPTGDEQADFDDMLRKFKQGVAENVEEDDHESHYDLGVAFKEMGLLDEAIAEFQKALRAPEGRLRTSEALGVAFFEKQQFAVSEAVLRRAKAQKLLQEVSTSDPDPRRRSRALSLLSVLLLSTPAADQQERATTQRVALANLQKAIETDPTNDEAKYNLEVVLRRRAGVQTVQGGPSPNPSSGQGQPGPRWATRRSGRRSCLYRRRGGAQLPDPLLRSIRVLPPQRRNP